MLRQWRTGDATVGDIHQPLPVFAQQFSSSSPCTDHLRAPYTQTTSQLALAIDYTGNLTLTLPPVAPSELPVDAR